jgi:hypothetical protein
MTRNLYDLKTGGGVVSEGLRQAPYFEIIVSKIRLFS